MRFVAAQLLRTAGSGTPWWIWMTVFAPLAAGFALVGVSWLRDGSGTSRSDRLGPPNWNFAASFASTLTVFGSLLGTILSANVLPNGTLVPASTYTGLNLMFGVIVIVGPLIYTATQTTVQVHRGSPVAEPQYQGTVWGFLVATALTLWAVIGELITIGLVLNEIRRGGSLPAVALGVMATLLAISAVSLLILADRRIAAILDSHQAQSRTKHTRQLALYAQYQSLGMPAEALPATEEINPSRPSWPLL
ncbi:MAG: hypothetical protein JO156_10075 [Solirubrobacterales bacterium]|nr:hypothetical protein [Solirubrobacterales bacterium]